MRIFIDTAKLEEIEKAYSYGILDGVTTNPSLIRKVFDGMKEADADSISRYIIKILETARGTPVSLEVVSTTYKEMVEEGRALFRKFNSVAGNVVVKIPINPSLDESEMGNFDGIVAIRTLSKEKIPVNCTLIFTPEQALMAAKAGAVYVSPFAGRIDDHIRDKNSIEYKKSDYFPAEGWRINENLLEDNGIVSGIDLIKQCRRLFDNYAIKTEILAASIRNPRQAREASLAGADIATLPFDVIEKMLSHNKTAEGMRNFTKDVVKDYANVLKQNKI